ncbi:tetratricopeptide repeat protein [Nocardia aobensis]|uniref:Tetratricopeptide repeat protein n=1 Tax=Nocardia aobensis TaxID=257277 RepID=A0ABW6P9L1_9NOCA
MASGIDRGNGHLPAEVTNFVGREVELGDIKRSLTLARLVTLIGPGGVGKTRLALRTAMTARRAFPDGVWFVDLSTLHDEELLTSTIARALKLQNRPSGWAPAVLSDQLHDRSLLLVLDNCEHLVDACAAVVHILLESCPLLRVLATSRQPLGVPGEHLHTIRPLPFPETRGARGPSGREAVRTGLSPAELEQFDAVTLFVERSRALDPRFRLVAENAEAVAALCDRLDGLPLAIELAAARIRHFSPQQILARLDETYGLLQTTSTATAVRQRSLRSLIMWSFDLCTPQEQTLWARLSVFAGSFTAEAAEATCSDDQLPPESVTAALIGLVDKSIMATEPSGPEVRYRMLTTIRAFGMEHLRGAGAEIAFRRRHRDYFRALASASYANWFGPNQLTRQVSDPTERDDLCAALDFALSENDGGEATAMIAAALVAASSNAGLLGDAQHWIDRVRAVLTRPSPALSVTLWLDGWSAMQQGDLDRAEPLLLRARDMAQHVGDSHESAIATAFLGMCRMLQGRLREALTIFDEAVERADADDAMCHAIVAARRGVTLFLLGDTERAVSECRRAIAVSEAHGELWHHAEATWLLATIRWQQGELDESEDLTRDALRTHRLFDSAVGTAQCLETLAWIAGSRTDHHRAARLLGAAEALWHATDTTIFPYLTGFTTECTEQARNALGDRSFREDHHTGLRARLEANVAFALGRAGAGGSGEVAALTAVLTKREAEIAELVANGASNKEIATKLVISPRTVDGHIAHIFDKLGFTSRVQIAAWVTSSRTGSRS